MDTALHKCEGRIIAVYFMRYVSISAISGKTMLGTVLIIQAEVPTVTVITVNVTV